MNTERLNNIESLRDRFTPNEIKLLHLDSYRNFLLYIDKFDSTNSKVIVTNLIDEYFTEIKSLNYSIDKNKSNELGFKYLREIGLYFRRELGFKYYTPLSSVMIIGGVIDLILLLFGLLERIYFVPIISTILLFEHFYIKIRYERKNKVYGLHYYNPKRNLRVT